jgi:hypothetical protein
VTSDDWFFLSYLATLLFGPLVIDWVLRKRSGSEERNNSTGETSNSYSTRKGAD